MARRGNGYDAGRVSGQVVAVADRVFAVVTLADVTGVVNESGQALINRSRKSNDGTQIILDFNHPRAAIDALFLPGVGVDAVISGCQMLTHADALFLMSSAAWCSQEPGGLNG